MNTKPKAGDTISRVSLLTHHHPRPATDQPYRWTLDEYFRVVETGTWDGRRLMLIRGELIEMAPQSDEHAWSISRTSKALRTHFTEDRFEVRVQSPFRGPDNSDPEPDICVLDGPTEEHPTHPTTALLVIEVAVSSQKLDRKKASLYAAAGVKDYWILDVPARQIEIYRNPRPIADGTWSYDPAIIVKAGESTTTAVMPNAPLRVDDLLP